MKGRMNLKMTVKPGKTRCRVYSGREMGVDAGTAGRRKQATSNEAEQTVILWHRVVRWVQRGWLHARVGPAC